MLATTDIWGIVDNAVLLESTSGNDETVVRALSHDTGDELWRHSEHRGAYTIIGDIAVQDSDSTFTGYRLESGEQVWELDADVGSSPTSFGRGGRLYVGGINRGAGELVTKAYDVDGELVWEQTGILTARATSNALFGTVGNLDTYQIGMLIEQ